MSWAPERAGPLVVCLNDGWGGFESLEDAAFWTPRAGEEPAPVLVYVEAGGAPRARDLRAAERMLAHGWEEARRIGFEPRLMLVCAPSVPAGVALASRALGGQAVLVMAAWQRQGQVVTLGLSVVELA